MEFDRTDRFARIARAPAVGTTTKDEPNAEERRRRRTKRVQDAWLRALHHSTGATDGSPPGGSLPPRPLV
jgi:hypothetical protein